MPRQAKSAGVCVHRMKNAFHQLVPISWSSYSIAIEDCHRSHRIFSLKLTVLSWATYLISVGNNINCCKLSVCFVHFAANDIKGQQVATGSSIWSPLQQGISPPTNLPPRERKTRVNQLRCISCLSEHNVNWLVTCFS